MVQSDGEAKNSMTWGQLLSLIIESVYNNPYAMKKPSRKLLEHLHWSEKPEVPGDTPKQRAKEKAYGERVRKLALVRLEQLKSPRYQNT